jgi:hypothetical protein
MLKFMSVLKNLLEHGNELKFTEIRSELYADLDEYLPNQSKICICHLSIQE